MPRDLDMPAAPRVRDLSLPPQQEKPGLFERAAKSVGETAADWVQSAGSIGGALNPVLAAGHAAMSYADPYAYGGQDLSLGDRWRAEMGQERANQAEADKRSPGASLIGKLYPMVVAPTSVPAAFSAAAPTAAGMLPTALRAAAGVGDAMTISGATTGLANLDNNPLGHAGEAMASPWNLLGGIGALAPEAYRAGKAAVGGAVDSVGGSLLKALAPRVKPTAAAQKLEEMGVKGLTVGQMEPNSVAGQVEEVSTALPFTGPAQKAAREAPKASWRQVVLEKVMPPGMKKLPAGDVTNQVNAIHDGFGTAYDAVTGQEIYPAIHDGKGGVPLQGTKNTPGAFDQIVADARVDEASAKTVKRFLDNQLTRLRGGTTRPGVVEKADVSDFLRMRTAIRSEVRRLRSDPASSDRVLLYEQAENAVTQAIESQIDPKLAEHLAATDQAYAQFMTVENAVSRAGTSGEFSPSDLGAAVKKGAGRSFARGGGGDLREAADLGEQVFSPTLERTGWGAQAVPYLPKPLTAAAAKAMNTPAGRMLLLRGQLPPRAPAPQIQSVQPSPLSAYSVGALGPRPAPEQSWVPAAAGNDTADFNNAMAAMLRSRGRNKR